MSKLSLIDKLNVLINVSMASQTYLIALVVLLVFGIILAFTNKKNEKLHKILYFIMTVVIIAMLVASYHSSLGKMINYMMNNFFIVVYFPNIAIYLAAIIAMNIIVWISIFSFKSSRQIRVLNISVYVIMNYLMALLLKIINSNHLDIFDQQSIYSNKEATSLIELSSIVFIVWIIFLVLYKIILIYIKKEYKPKVKRIIVRKKVKKLPENFEPTMTPEKVYGNIPHRETLVINTNEVLKTDDVIDTSEKTEDEILLEHFSKQFTLEDYKLFARILKEQQEKESTETVDKTTEIDEYREAQKQEIIRMEEERRELLRQEQERLEEEKRKIEEDKEKQKRIQELQQKEDERERRKIERKLEAERARLAEEQKKLEEEKERLLKEKQQEIERQEQERIEKEERRKQEEKQQREEAALERLLQQTLEAEEKEQRKLSELEMLYR